MHQKTRKINSFPVSEPFMFAPAYQMVKAMSGAKVAVDMSQTSLKIQSRKKADEIPIGIQKM